MIRPLFPDLWEAPQENGDHRSCPQPIVAPVPAHDLFRFLANIPGRLDIDRWASRLGDRPCENMLGLLGLTTLLFYRAEKGHNPKVKDVWDALVYCSTCFSVGYGDIFAHTPAGKAIGSLLMAIGPSMAAKALDGPARDEVADSHREERDTLQRETLTTLKEILAELREKE